LALLGGFDDRNRVGLAVFDEMEEMQLCDRVYVFRNGAIVAELVGDAISEQNILRASFEGAAA